MTGQPRIVIIGAGMGGLATAAALRDLGLDAHLCEQAKRFARIGAGIQMSPNAMRALRGLGLDALVRRTAFQPRAWNNRVWDTGAVQYELPLGPAAETKFGAPYLQMHRGDLHAALLTAVPADSVSLNKQLVGLMPAASGTRLSFADGTELEADLVIGADGIHSRVREYLLGEEMPVATGRVAYRATFAATELRQSIGECTKWWGEDRHIVIYFVTSAKDEVYFVTSLPDDAEAEESWSATGDMTVVREAFAEFHDEVREVLRACPAVHRWAILEREPLDCWHRGGVVLIGDAAHPMTPYMAQGAAMAIEDGVELARALHGTADVETALQAFEASRMVRTARVQAISHANTWMREETDPTWCYDYDPWTAPLQV